MIPLAVALVTALMVFGVYQARKAKEVKREAIKDLQIEKASVGAFSILDLVEEETARLGLADLDGSDGVPHGVLLKVWSNHADIVSSCEDTGHLQYVLADGVQPSEATEDTLTLVCPGS